MTRLSVRFVFALIGAVVVPAGAQEVSQVDSMPAPLALEPGANYRVYTSGGDSSSLQSIVSRALGEDVLLVGEEHGDLIGHRIEAVLLEAVIDTVAGGAGAGRPVVLSMEMFERDVQLVVDEYLDDLVTEAHFMSSSRPWTDYEVRYRPLVEAARGAGVPVVAANAPRRYVNRVTRQGPWALEELSADARAFLPPIPYPLASPAYRAEWDAIMSEYQHAAQDEEANDRMLAAQALWDASMGHAITEALVEHLGALVVHYAGSFHVDHGLGIPERIADYRPGTRVTTVVIRPVEDVNAWVSEDHTGLGDFVILTKRADPEATADGS
ncbi:MAG: ChaN family lipoprotein [Gemmatimonadota bacterium]